MEQQNTPKIYAFVNGSAGFGSDVIGVAVAEDGAVLASHWSSNAGWARHDMGADGECKWKHDIYAEHYPNGFDVEWVGDVESHPILSAILSKMNAEVASAEVED